MRYDDDPIEAEYQRRERELEEDPIQAEYERQERQLEEDPIDCEEEQREREYEGDETEEELMDQMVDPEANLRHPTGWRPAWNPGRR